MKFCLLFVLFLLFVVLAIGVYLKYYYRYIVFKDMVYLCKSLKNNISFNKNTIEMLLKSASKKISNFTKNLICGNMSKKSICLTGEDVLEINGFIGSLGKGNVDYEINNISYYENEFEDKKQSSKNDLDKDGKMYLKLIIGIGLAICIILI